MRVIDFIQDPAAFLTNPVVLIILAFQIWMFVDALRREEWLWAAFIFLFPLINAIRSANGDTRAMAHRPATLRPMGNSS